MKTINLNSTIRVKLTDYGKDIFYHQYDELNDHITKNGGTPIKPSFLNVDSDGYSEFQLWSFMRVYGKYMELGSPNVIEPLNIGIDENDLDEASN